MWWWHLRSLETSDQEESDQSSESEMLPAHPAAAELINLQHAVGNQTVQRIVAESPGTDPDISRESSSSNATLPAGTLQQMEDQLGHELGDVRVHTDQESATSAVERGSQAYTVGRDIYFAPGKYAPHTPEGIQLLSHELAHVVQQSKRADGNVASGIDAEREAEHVSERIPGPVDVPLSPVRAGTPMGAPANWSKDVADAKSKKDADVMAALIETAIATTKKKVVVAKTSPGGNIDPKDYKPLPAINFDINLNSKKSKLLTTGAAAAAATHSLSPNYGYAFSDGGNLYVVLGPNSLNEDGPTFTMMYYEHEMYHTTHHLVRPSAAAPATTTKPAPGPTPVSKPAVRTDDEEELETWTQDFLHYFHELRSFRAGWIPLIEYYEKSSPGERATALALLKGYYNSPPSPPIPASDVAAVKKSFEAWVRRRLRDSATSTKQLIVDLAKDLGISLSSSGSSGTAGPTPSSSSGTPP